MEETGTTLVDDAIALVKEPKFWIGAGVGAGIIYFMSK